MSGAQAKSYNAVFAWQPADYLALCRAQRVWRPQWRQPLWTDYAVWLVLGLIGGWAIWPKDWAAAAGFAGAVVTLLSIVDFVLLPWVWRRQFKKQGLEGRQVTLSADITGLSVTTPTSHARHAWDHLARVDRFETYTILWESRHAAYIVPDRALGDGQDAVAFHEFLNGRLAAHKVQQASRERHQLAS